MLPAIAALRAKYPDARLDVALPVEYAELLRSRLDGARVIACDYRKFRPRWRRILAARYDLTFDLSGPQPLSGAADPNRIEHFARICGVWPDTALNGCPTWDIGLARDLVPRLALTQAERVWARNWLAERGIRLGERPLVCLHLKSASSRKDWPLDKFGELARRLIDRDVRVVALEKSLRLDTPGIVGACGLSLPRAAALIAACDVLVGPDSGPMHLAAAVGTPCVALFGPTNPHVVLKHYAATHCWIWRPNVADIGTDEVLAKVEELLHPDDRPATAHVRTTVRNPQSEIRNRKILFVSDKVYPAVLGGAEISMHRLLDHLGRNGFETQTRTWQKHSKRDLGELIRSADPDWVFTQLRVAPDVVREAKRQGRRAAVFVCSLGEHLCNYRKDGLHACIETGGRAEPLTCSLGCMRRRRDVNVQREMFRSADLVSCNSDYTRRVIERVFGRRAIIQYPLIAGPTRPGVRVHRYLTAIRPAAGKGRKVFEQLVRLLDNREFLVVGGGKLDVPWERVAYLPAVVNMNEAYRSTRILLQPAADAECFGRNVAEVAAFGIPSVVSRQGALPEALGPGGLAVDEFEDPEEWVRAIQEVERNYPRYSKLALEHSKEFRSIDAVLGALRAAGIGRASGDGPARLCREHLLKLAREHNRIAADVLRRAAA